MATCFQVCIIHTSHEMIIPRVYNDLGIDRCEVPPDSSEQARMHLLVSWIIDHPNALVEEEVILRD